MTNAVDAKQALAAELNPLRVFDNLGTLWAPGAGVGTGRVFNPRALRVLYHAATEDLTDGVNKELLELFSEIENGAFAKPGFRLSLDIETTGLDPHSDEITLIGFTVDGVTIHVAAPNQIPAGQFRQIMKDPRITKVFHNAKFEMKFLAKHFGCDFANVQDTFIGRGLLIAGLDQYTGSLDECAEVYLEYQMDKTIRQMFIGNRTITNGMVYYCAIDVAATYEIYPHVMKALVDNELCEVYAFIEIPLVPVVAKLELNGAPVDAKRLEEFRHMLTVRVDGSEEEAIKGLQHDLDAFLAKYGAIPTKKRKLLVSEKKARGIEHVKGQDVSIDEPVSCNTRSSNIMLDVMQKLGFTDTDTKASTLEAPTYTDASMRAAAERFSAALGLPEVMSNDEAAKISYEALELVMDVRAARNALSKFIVPILSEFINPVTGRVHASFWQLGTKTGRFSVSEPALQQMPNASRNKIFGGMPFRAIFVAPPGHKIITFDYNACEMRIMADISQDPALMHSVTTEDPHTANAAFFYEVDMKDVNKDQRRNIKTVGFCLLYGGGYKKVAATIKAPLGHAKELVDNFKLKFSGLNQYIRNQHTSARTLGYTISMSGRKRFYDLSRLYPGALAAIERRAQNMPIQATNADITKLAMIWVDKAISPYGAYISLTIHDELVVICPDEHVETVFKLVEENMIAAEREFLTRVPCVVDGKIGDFWNKE